MGRETRFAALALCFLLSGFAALVYQTAWTREFAFVFGTSELAIAVVLAAYMAGLAVGSAVGGRIAPRVTRPVLAYGLMELGIGLSALAVPLGLAATRLLLLHLFGGQAGLPPSDQVLPAIFGLASSFLVMMVPTAFMGATLPLLTRYAVRREGEIGLRVGLLYAVNTAGAVGGTLAAAFFLLSRLGLRGTIESAVVLNGVVFVLASALSRGASAEPEQAGPPRAPLALANRWVLPLIGASGFVSFSYEVLWTRLLSHLLGGSVYAFAVMLASVLVGITLGAAAAVPLATDQRRAGLSFAAAELGAGALSLVAFVLSNRLPGWVGAASYASGAFGSQLLVAFAVLLPPAFCVGLTYPLAVRLLARRADQAAAASAWAYAWNTGGAILGALSCAYLTLPSLFFVGTLKLLVVVNAALALATLLLAERRRLLPIAVAALALLLAAAFTPPRPWKLLETSALGGHEAMGDVDYFAVGRSATVLLSEVRPESWRLRTNGLPEALIVSQEALSRSGLTSRWLGALPALLRPETRTMLSVGLGGGVHLEAIPDSVRRIDVVELEPDVVAADRVLAGKRMRDPLSDPRVHVVVNDARSALLLSGARYDAIVAQASHPWTSGSSHLYTEQFFQLVAQHLSPDGIFVQWMGRNFVDGKLLRSLVATLRAVWPHVNVYIPPGGGMLFVASRGPLAIPTGWIRTLLARDPAAMAALGIATPVDLEVALRLDDAGCAAFGAGAAVNTDDRNTLEMRSPQVIANKTSLKVRGFPRDFLQLDALRSPRPPQQAIRLVQRLLQLDERRLAAVVAKAVRDEASGRVARALVALAGGRNWKDARDLLSHTQIFRPEASAALALSSRNLVLQGVEVGSDAAKGLDGPAGTLVEGWSLRERGDWRGLRGMDGALAAIDSDSVLFGDASWLRADWRLHVGTRADRAVAARLLDRAIARGMEYPEWALTRAELFARAGQPGAALALLTQALARGGAGNESVRLAAEAFLRDLPLKGEWDQQRKGLLHRLAGHPRRLAIP